jgi:hypothetical protein
VVGALFKGIQLKYVYTIVRIPYLPLRIIVIPSLPPKETSSLFAIDLVFLSFNATICVMQVLIDQSNTITCNMELKLGNIWSSLENFEGTYGHL